MKESDKQQLEDREGKKGRIAYPEALLDLLVSSDDSIPMSVDVSLLLE